ncbi:MAG: hypothetical protein QNJ97_18675 [Myxococcota bacterium]|nr:hypothetical protein [Myxococcota bacterium]
MTISRRTPMWALAALLLLGCGQEVKIIEVDPTTISFTKRSQSRELKVVAKDILDAPVPNIPISFSSENSQVASVDSGGTVKPVGNGSTAIVAKAPNGSQGESFIKVCLPNELVCDPSDTLQLKVGLAAPIKCQVKDCNGELIRGAPITYTQLDRTVVLKEAANIFIGLKVGDTAATVTAFDLETRVKIHVDEQAFLPGMGPDAGGHRRSGGGGGKEKSGDAYGKGKFDHILKNMKF